MKIVMDCFKLVKGVGKSIGIYNVALNLSKRLVEYKLNNNDDVSLNSIEFVVIGNKYNKADFSINGIEFVEIDNYNPLNKFHCLYWELFAVSGVVKKLKADRVIFPRGFCALTHPVPDTIIIHDLIPFFYNENFPGYFNRFENAYIMRRMKSSVKSCNRVITISEASRKDILKYCGIDEKRITVIHNGCNEINICRKKDLGITPYICSITSPLPHKNATGVFESYKRYCEISSNPLNLVVIGVDDVYKEQLPLSIQSKIVCYKYIKENEDLHRIILNSSAFLFLSLAEGFGFPPIEAMQLRIPVICSNYSSLPEIVGDAAILVNPKDYTGVARAIEELTTSKDMQDDLIKKGIKNIDRFNWHHIAKQYWDSLLSKGGTNES